MRKRIKAKTLLLTACFLGSLMLGMGNVSASALEVDINQMRNYLVSIQMPELYIDTLNDDMIEETYKEYKSAYVEIGEDQIAYLNENDGEIKTRGTIPSNEMQFSIFPSYFYKNASTKEVDYVKISVYFEWLKFPVWHKTDAMVVNWDSNVFTYKINTFKSYEIIAFDGVIRENREYTELAELTQGGLGFDVSLNAALFQDEASRVSAMRGGASFSLLPSQNPMYQGNTGSYYTTSVIAQYRHNRNPFVGSVGFSVSGFSVGFDLSMFTDTVANGCNINYKY